MLPNEQAIAWSWPELASAQHLAAINLDQEGVELGSSPACGIEFAVWTGTSPTGQFMPPNCDGWQDLVALGVVGNAEEAGPGWSASNCHAPCDKELPVYCVQE